MNLVRLALAMLAAYRVTQLVVYDEGPWSLFLRLRMRMGVYDRRANGEAKTLKGRLFACPYCMGMYVSCLMAIPVLLPGWLSDLVLIASGVAGAQAVLETLLRRASSAS